MFTRFSSIINGKSLGLLGVTGAGAFAASRCNISPIRLLAESSHPNAFYQFTAKDIDGNVVDMSKYQGQVCVVVNVASK